ncbi:MAG: hypothetical protein AYK19_15320 [Theionarchaea archaeon DG-70-1]|nr:MAG: hypothetical protein AYK19_15320 [Theionarchaea archaeon DG-70-1]
MLDYLVLAMAPGMFWLWFFWRKDKYEKEPARYLMITFFLGVVMVFPALILEVVFELLFGVSSGVAGNIMVGIVEEACKFMAVFLFVYRKNEFNEVVDGIIYAAAAALGFASLENFFYILKFGPGVMVVRAVVSTLGHVLFASFWGYSLGVKKITGVDTVFIGLISAMGAHAIFNIILEAPYWWVNLLVIPLMIILYRSMSRKIERSLDESPFKEVIETAALVKCKACNKYVPRNVQFCPHCGNHVETVAPEMKCPKCGADVLPRSKYCSRCGERI